LTTYLSRSAQETLDIAAHFVKILRAGDVVALFGGLGMGKTVFVRGLAKGLGLGEDQVSSPTFSLVNEYRGADCSTLYHFDMYRIEGEEALYCTGFYDYLGSGDILAVEWSENIAGTLPENAISVTISPGEGETDRVIAISAKGIAL